MAKNTVGYWRNKADALLTPIIKKLFPKCFICKGPTQVAHHFIHKSKSTALRYVLENLIPLCHKCHIALHHNESEYTGRIIRIKGMEWFNALVVIKNRAIVKADWCYFKANYDRLLSEL